MVLWLTAASAYWHASLGVRRNDSPRGARARSIRVLKELAQQSDRVGDRARSLLRNLPEIASRWSAL